VASGWWSHDQLSRLRQEGLSCFEQITIERLLFRWDVKSIDSKRKEFAI